MKETIFRDSLGITNREESLRFFDQAVVVVFKSYQVVVQNSITEQGGGLINEEELGQSGLFLSRVHIRKCYKDKKQSDVS
ncbi:hypothetical protein [Mangrovibacterium marinum]|uniref:hypothetical protein n=1 Tax=Mangrovibacterium marinum TaxID=1639118 RepID=UPI001474ADD1|nr:hypothetical protein [Mangrovibacterium marinum]